MTDSIAQELNLSIEQSSPDEWVVIATLNRASLRRIEDTIKRLRYIKAQISTKYKVPIEFLEIIDTVYAENSPDSIISTLRVKLNTIEKGDPEAKLTSKIGITGREYKNMVAILTIFPLTEAGESLKDEHVQAALSASKIADEYINHAAVSDLVQQMHIEAHRVTGIIAQGIMPQEGSDAKIDYKFETKPNAHQLDDFYKSLRVKSGQLLCQKANPTVGTGAGKNLFDEIVTPANGLDTTLNAGDGVTYGPGQLTLYATRDGVVDLKIVERSSKYKDRPMCPKEISVSVSPIKVIVARSAINMVSEEAIEVHGNLEAGSNITSKGNVYITGNVSGDSVIRSDGNVVVEGNTQNATIECDQGVIVSGNISQSRVNATAKVFVSGTTDSSKIITDEAVEVRGNVGDGSEITSGSSVFVFGDVSEKVAIDSRENIVVEGNVRTASLNSDKNIIVKGSITQANLVSREDITIQEDVSDSRLVGSIVTAKDIQGVTVVARSKIILENISRNENGIPNELVVSPTLFSSERFSQNEKVVSSAESAVQRIESFFGAEVMQELGTGYAHMALVRFMKNMRNVRNEVMGADEINNLKTLLESVRPTREIITARKQENIQIKSEIQQGSLQSAKIVIKGKVNDSVKIKINDSEVTIDNGALASGGVSITKGAGEEKVIVEPAK